MGKTKYPAHTMVERGPCPTCGKMFKSSKHHGSKTYCNMKCYTASKQFKQRLEENYKKGHETSSKKWDKKMTRVCPVCGKTHRFDRSKRQFCSRVCYRQFSAELFDAFIADPGQIKIPSHYDEFMMQEELPCFFKGCKWKGKGLAGHMAQKHGAPADEMKKLAGFNLSTGLVSPELSRKLSARDLVGVAIDEKLQKKGKASPRVARTDYISDEMREHQRKATATKNAEGVDLETGIRPLFTDNRFCSRVCMYFSGKGDADRHCRLQKDEDGYECLIRNDWRYWRTEICLQKLKPKEEACQ